MVQVGVSQVSVYTGLRVVKNIHNVAQPKGKKYSTNVTQPQVQACLEQ